MPSVRGEAGCVRKSSRELGPEHREKAIWGTWVVSPLPSSGRGLKDIDGPNEND